MTRLCPDIKCFTRYFFTVSLCHFFAHYNGQRFLLQCGPLRVTKQPRSVINKVELAHKFFKMCCSSRH